MTDSAKGAEAGRPPEDASGAGATSPDCVDAVVTVPVELLPSFYAAVGEWFGEHERQGWGKTRL